MKAEMPPARILRPLLLCTVVCWLFGTAATARAQEASGEVHAQAATAAAPGSGALTLRQCIDLALE